MLPARATCRSASRRSRGAIAWSYDLLDDGQKRLLCAAGSVRRRLGPRGAEAVCGPADEIGIDVLDGIMALADQSLVRSRGGRRDDPLPPARHDPRVRRRAARGGRRARRRSRDATRPTSSPFVEQAAPELASPDQRRWLGLLERDHDNIRAAMDRAVADADADTAIRIGFAMWRYWQKRGHLRRPSAGSRRSPPSPGPATIRSSGRGSWRRSVASAGGWATCGDARPGVRRGARDLAGDRRQEGDRQRPLQPLVQVRGHERPDERRPGRDRSCRDRGGARGSTARSATSVARRTSSGASATPSYFRATATRAQPRFAEALEIFRRVGDRTMEAWSLHMLGSSQHQDGQRGRGRGADRGGPPAVPRSPATWPGSPSRSTTSRRSPSREDDLPRAARLWGAARALSSAGGSCLADLVDEQFETCRPPERPASGWTPAELERYAREGRAMSVDETRGVRAGDAGVRGARAARARGAGAGDDAASRCARGSTLLDVEPTIASGAHRRRRRRPRRRHPDLRQLRRGDGRAKVQADLPLRLLPVLLGLLLMPIDR